MVGDVGFKDWKYIWNRKILAYIHVIIFFLLTSLLVSAPKSSTVLALWINNWLLIVIFNLLMLLHIPFCDYVHTRWQKYQRSYFHLPFAVRTWRFRTHGQSCSPQRSMLVRISTNSFWICCWKVSVEHVRWPLSFFVSSFCILFSLEIQFSFCF